MEKFPTDNSETVTSAGQWKQVSQASLAMAEQGWVYKDLVPVAGTNTRCCITRDRNLDKGHHDVIAMLTKLKASLSTCSSTQKILFFSPFKLHGLLFLKYRNCMQML